MGVGHNIDCGFKAYGGKGDIDIACDAL